MPYQKPSTGLTIIIPLFNECESLPELYQRITHEMSLLNYNYEIIFVDDGSTDGSFGIINELRSQDSCVKGVRLRKNFGKSLALNEGFRFSSGDLLVTMDADLQDDPIEIPRMLDKINEGYDLVSGWKKERKDSVFSKNIPSMLFNLVVSWGSGLKLHDFNCGFKVYRRSVVEKLYLYGDMHRFVPALAHSHGFKVTEIPVKHHTRRFGVSKFGLSRFTHGLFDFLTVLFLVKFLKRPMHFFGGLGSIVSLFGILICIYLTLMWFSGEAIGHRPLLILGILLVIVGIQLVTTGLLAELYIYNSRKHDHGENVEERLGFV